MISPLYPCFLFLCGVVCLITAALCFFLLLGAKGIGVDGNAAVLIGCIGFTWLSHWFIHLALSSKI